MTDARFEKLDGAGNDFVLLRSPTPVPDATEIRFLLDRHHGVGGDGLLHLTERSRREGELDAVVLYWNADGGSAEYCGNGARCVASVLLAGREDDAEVHFRLSEVVVRARRESPSLGGEGPAGYAVAHPVPRRLLCPAEIEVWARGMGLLRPPEVYDSGVPHLLLEVTDARAFDLARWAPGLRQHPAWGPAGTNVDVVSLEKAGQPLRVRTWERGVEGETLACGSGLLAVGEWMRSRSGGTETVSLESASGALFRVWLAEGALWLSGPARTAFRGEITIP